MGIIAIVISVFATFSAIITLAINFGLLYQIFISKKLKKSNSLTFFYLRFFIDGLMSADGLVIVVFFSFRLSNIETIFDTYPVIVFYINWPSAILLSIRSVLVVIITLDRTIAIFLPLLYHNKRRNFSLLIIVLLLMGYICMENYILWVVCEFVVYVPPGCINMWCFMNQCFIDFFLKSELISHAIIVLLSLVLAIKLLVWNRLPASSSEFLTRANRLVLIDAFIIIVFDVFPAALMTKIYTGKFEDIGPVIMLSKMSGYALEGYLVICALKRIDKNNKASNVKSISTVKVKPSRIG
ncbi:Protein CBG06329 [Caenorhabditis briggsae]|uniref:G-protein coupled receptors family 1 profile domain-containing protein n=2 Tax=Caenorhabditis briggsae TaxID=6238 RepID=A0AAE9A3D0_CAEBR|nr:Protein CBG06329 [Caenorhabditis briggsae]ULT87842.1 hypothetical protein L3Y34_007192 [Caenorhabditis briggsae]UMM33629.1 hypothetical protein L5515_007034 [Caenorhabditis briggsae]CAP26653.1 Protein CBG06329 [Caenorhabditis briggsae]